MAIMGKVREEKCFPRGNVETKPPLVKAKSVKRKVEKDLFSNREQKAVNRKKVKKGKSAREPESLFDLKSVPSLRYSDLSEGQVLLGFVCQVLEFEVKVSLPGQLVGSVPITNISPAFTARLRGNMAEEEGEEKEGEEEVPQLGQLFKPGQVVAVAVVSLAVSGSDTASKHSVILSLAPARVSAGRSPAVGEILTAAVTSKEDHGYIMDLGSNTIRGFVTTKLMSKLGNVEVGEVIWCLVTKSDVGVRTLSPVPAKVWSSTCSAPSLHNLFPGSRVAAKVESHLSNGLKLSLEGNYLCLP